MATLPLPRERDVSRNELAQGGEDWVRSVWLQRLQFSWVRVGFRDVLGRVLSERLLQRRLILVESPVDALAFRMLPRPRGGRA